VVERVYVLYRGEVVESGPVDRVLDAPEHPYTARLVESVPRTDPGWLAGGSESAAPHAGGDGGA
jgi:peptide/nickel transport system ATP-binding protein